MSIQKDLLKNDFFKVPNRLLDFQDSLGLSDGELLYIIKVLRFSEGWAVNTSKICSTSSGDRYRRTLRKKGYLTTTIKNNGYKRMGTIHNFDGLWKKIFDLKKQIPNMREPNTQIGVNNKTIDNKTILSSIDSSEKNQIETIQNLILSQIQEVKDSIETPHSTEKYIIEDTDKTYYYFLNYRPSVQEIRNFLSEGHNPDIFHAYGDYLLNELWNQDTIKEKLIQPKISLLLKNPLRMKKLFDYFEDWKEINPGYEQTG